jgi:uncharacterized membrane protein (UPF0127 family)
MPRSRLADRFARPAALACLAVALSSGVGPGGTPVAQAQPATERPMPNPRLPQVEIRAGMHLIRAEVAADGPTRQRGLMMRERLGPNEGMLFVFEQKAGHCFWMKNTLIPLSIAFLDDDGSIVNIADMQPHAEDSHCPVRPVRYALEMEQGWFAKRGLKAGARLVQPQMFRSN